MYIWDERRLIPYQKDFYNRNKINPAMKRQCLYSYKTFTYIHHTMPVGIMLLGNWVVLPFHWEMHMLLIVTAASFMVGTPARHRRQEGKKRASSLLPTLKLQQSTHHSSSAALSRIWFICVEIHSPLNLSIASWWLCMTRTYFLEGTTAWKHCQVWTGQQYFTSIKTANTSLHI